MDLKGNSKSYEENDCNNALVDKGKQSKLELHWRHSVKQILAACIAHSLVIQVGINMTFSAVLLPQLRDENSEIKINIYQASWIASIVTASLPLGALTIGVLMDKFGRKKMCMLTAVPFLASWMLHYFATNVWYIYVGRMIAGFGGGLSTVAIVYVSEISHLKYRPMLLTFNSVFVTFGILLTYVLGVGLHWTTMVMVFFVLAALSTVGLCFIPESPYWLMVFKNDKLACAKSVEWLYKDATVAEQQYEAITRIAHHTDADRPNTDQSQFLGLKDQLSFKNPIVRTPMIILLILFVFQQLSSAYVILFYAVDIFRKIGGSFMYIGLIDEFSALILLGSIRFFMAIILAIISNKMGRRVLMFCSAVGMIATSFALGMYMHLTRSTHVDSINYNTTHQNFDATNESNGTIAVVLVLCYICFSSCGWLIIPWTLIGELLPVKVRGVLGGVMVSIAYILMSIIVKKAPFVMQAVPLEFIFLGLSVVNVCGLIFIYFFLPETLGKSFNDIANHFSKRRNGVTDE
ncbi:facilitated trehalose transporter Tret1-like [Euwallacea similis]|uniref:facilitated trehalose transporter Tret1-like n=1 Tax=Euwallacea similis TaxID=1736056 RepID=UPI00344C9DE1